MISADIGASWRRNGHLKYALGLLGMCLGIIKRFKLKLVLKLTPVQICPQAKKKLFQKDTQTT